MKIEKATVYYVETDEDRFTRHSAENWTVVMGESDEQVYLCKGLETEFQKELSKLSGCSESEDYNETCAICGKNKVRYENMVCQNCIDNISIHINF